MTLWSRNDNALKRQKHKSTINELFMSSVYAPVHSSETKQIDSHYLDSNGGGGSFPHRFRERKKNAYTFYNHAHMHQKKKEFYNPKPYLLIHHDYMKSAYKYRNKSHTSYFYMYGVCLYMHRRYSWTSSVINMHIWEVCTVATTSLYISLYRSLQGLSRAQNKSCVKNNDAEAPREWKMKVKEEEMWNKKMFSEQYYIVYESSALFSKSTTFTL